MDLLTEFRLPLDKEQNEWITNWLISDAYYIIALTLTIVQIIIMPILFTLHVYRLMKGQNEIKQEKTSPLYKRYLIIDNLSLAAIAFSFISGIITIANYSSIFNDSTCRIITVTQNMFWLFTKIAIYIVVLLRLQCAFKGSAFAIQRKYNKICYTIIALFSFVLGFGTILPYPIGVDSVPLQHTNFCLLIIPPWLIITPMIFDILCSSISMYLFINPIKHILKNTKNVPELQKLLTKYILISTIAIVSNLFSSIWFAVTDILIFTYFDSFVNPICLILMQIHHDDIYFMLCKHCHKSLGKLMRFPEHSVTENVMMHIHENGSKNQIQSPAIVPTEQAPSASGHIPPLSPMSTVDSIKYDSNDKTITCTSNSDT